MCQYVLYKLVNKSSFKQTGKVRFEVLGAKYVYNR